MLTERLCITNNEIPKYLSTQYIISCDGLDFGCNGGHLENTVNFLSDPIPLFSSFPYLEKESVCPNIDYQTYLVGCRNQKHLTSIDQIKREIIDKGPVVANMVVFKDLVSYVWGIYQTEGGFE